MTALVLFVLLAVAALWTLAANARAYVRHAEERWPAEGRFVDVSGARMHVVERGPEHALRVLLIHGASANLREVLPPLMPLAEDHRLIAYDRPGHGHSAPLRDAPKLATQARVAAAVLEATGGGPAIVVGQSLGAAVALRLALDRPELVRGLVLSAPASHPYPGENAWWARLSATPVIGALFANFLVPWLAPAVSKGGIANTFAPAPAPKNYFDDAGVGLAFRPRAFIASARDVCATKAEFIAQAPRYGDILTPAIIITADKDRVVSPKLHARALAAELSAAEMVTAPGAGHMPHRVRSDLVIAAVRRVETLQAPTPVENRA